MLTIFTPTYNRAHTLPRLYESLKRQTSRDFEWLVIDDGSNDDTETLFNQWLKEAPTFNIRYLKVENRGKNRALNLGIKHAAGDYFMILDSDDLLTDDAVEFSNDKIKQIEYNDDFIGISGKRADINTGKPIGLKGDSYAEDGYFDCSNLERYKYGLERDMAEVFITDKLRKYEFKVWPGEKFTPEEVVWNQMALEGYKLRWYNKITYLCEYQKGGLSDSSWSLLARNPMGYAMMWNHRLLYLKGLRNKMNATIQYAICCILAKEWRELFSCNYRLMNILLLPVSAAVSIRRKRQIAKYQ